MLNLMNLLNRVYLVYPVYYGSVLLSFRVYLILYLYSLVICDLALLYKVLFQTSSRTSKELIFSLLCLLIFENRQPLNAVIIEIINSKNQVIWLYARTLFIKKFKLLTLLIKYRLFILAIIGLAEITNSPLRIVFKIVLLLLRNASNNKFLNISKKRQPQNKRL